MCQSTKRISIIHIIQIIIPFFQVEKTFLALSSLTFSSISLKHSVFQSHVGVGFTKSSILECSPMISGLVFGEELCFSFFKTGLFCRTGVSSYTLELSSTDIVFKLMISS
jgi:hypothetical protein